MFYNMAQIKPLSKPPPLSFLDRICIKTETWTFSHAWNFYLNVHNKTIDLEPRNYTRNSAYFYWLATGNGARDPCFQPTPRARSTGRRALAQGLTPSNYSCYFYCYYCCLIYWHGTWSLAIPLDSFARNTNCCVSPAGWKAPQHGTRGKSI